MVKTDFILKSPIALTIGLLLLFSITACESEITAEETTLLFWSAIAKNNLELAKKYCTTQSLPLPSEQHDFQNTTFDYGKIVIDGNHATVETKISPPSNNKSSFSTFLLEEDNRWQVDYQRSISDFYGNQLFKEFLKQLNTLGEDINKKLEQQLPIIEKEIELFGQELKQKIDDFSHELKKAHPPKSKQNPYKESI